MSGLMPSSFIRLAITMILMVLPLSTWDPRNILKRARGVWVGPRNLLSGGCAYGVCRRVEGDREELDGEFTTACAVDASRRCWCRPMCPRLVYFFYMCHGHTWCNNGSHSVHLRDAAHCVLDPLDSIARGRREH